MKLIYAATLTFFFGGISFSQDFGWARSMGSFSVDRAHGIAVDSEGNVYSTGIFSSSADLDPGSGTVTFSSAGNYDMFIQKLDASGNLVWAKHIGGIMDDVPNSLMLDADNNVLVSGYFSDQVDFDPGAGTAMSATAGNYDVFILKLDEDGDFIWARTFGASGGDYANTVAVDAAGNVLAAGIFAGTVDFDPGAGTSALTNPDDDHYDSFLLKLDATGNFLWAKHFTGAQDEYARTVSVDPSGNIYTAGYFYGTVDFDPSAGITSLSSAGGADIFVQKLQPNGDFVWVKRMGGEDHDYPQGMDAAFAGSVGITGTFRLAVDFDPDAGVTELTAGEMNDNFVLKLDAEGALVWAKSFGSSNVEFSRAISIDNAGNFYTTGNINDTLDLDPGPGEMIFEPLEEGTPSLYVQKLDAAGDFQWAGIVEPTSGTNSTCIAVDANGVAYIAGSYRGSADFDPTTGESVLSALANEDIFVVKLGEGAPAGMGEEFAHQLKAFPNPSKDKVTIEMDRLYDNLEVQIVSVDGSILCSQSFMNTDRITLDLSTRQGIVFVCITDGYRQSVVKINVE